MSKERELLKKAASFLHDTYDGVSYMEILLREIDEVLEEPVAKPVAWMVKFQGAGIMLLETKDERPDFEDGSWVEHEYIPLYTHPPRQPVQLSDDEKVNCYESAMKQHLRPQDKSAVLKVIDSAIAAYEEKQK